MEMYQNPRPINDYLNKTFVCSCGKMHKAPLRDVCIRRNALEELPGFMWRLGFGKNLFLITDSITYRVAGRQCAEVLKRAAIPYKIVQLQNTGFDEATLGELLMEVPDDCDLLVAVGSGSINDITKLIGCKTGRPCITVATAPSMDGFASGVAAVHANQIKVTLEAQTPLAIIGDTEILKDAPYQMIAAGLGDLLGKVTCLCDWKLSQIINGEHFCEPCESLIASCVDHVLEHADAAKDRDPEIIGSIMEGLVLAGVTMSLYGNSRPASGCEHHISHFWEMLFAQRGRRPVFHGTQVGVGTVLILRMIEKLRCITVDFKTARANALSYDADIWRREIQAVYGPAASGIIELEASAKKNETDGRLRRIDNIEKNWEQISETLHALPSSSEIERILNSLGSPCLPFEIGVDAGLMKRTFLYCKEVRARYTLLQMVWDLGLLDRLSDEVIQDIYPKGMF